MANIVRSGGCAGNEAHKLTYEDSKSTKPYNTWYYSDTVDAENSASKEVDYMLFVSQSYNFTGIIKIQGSDDSNTWSDIDSINAVNGYKIKIGSSTVTYRYFRFAAYHPDGGTTFKALMIVTEL